MWHPSLAPHTVKSFQHVVLLIVLQDLLYICYISVSGIDMSSSELYTSIVRGISNDTYIPNNLESFLIYFQHHFSLVLPWVEGFCPSITPIGRY